VIPGGNILNIALSVINPQGVYWYSSNGSVLNDIGQNVTTYLSPVIINGSFQPLSKQVIFTLGLDVKKSYYKFYSSHDFKDLDRDRSPDLLVSGSNVYQIESNEDWYNQDSWMGTLTSYSGLSVPSLFKNGSYVALRKDKRA